MKDLHLDIISPEGEIYKGKVESVMLPGTLGSFTVLPQHAPIVSSLKAGTVSYAVGGEEHSLTIRGGFVELSNNRVTACVEL